MNEKSSPVHLDISLRSISQEEIDCDVNYYKAQKVSKAMLELGLISLSEFNKLTRINRDTFSPFLVELMPEIR